MRKSLVNRLSDFFKPSDFNDIDTYKVMEALTDQVALKRWLLEILQEIKRINLAIDGHLRNNTSFSIEELSARRRTLQFVLESALGAKREVQRERGHNPAKSGSFDLDSVTVEPAPR